MDDAAARLGLFVGQKATDAAALVPNLETAEADTAADAVALVALADWCARFSPAVALDPPDCLFLDITGVAHLWGGEAAMAADLISRLTRAGIPARVAVAGSPGAAWARAHFAQTGMIVFPGGEAAGLRGLPTAALRLAPTQAAQIARLGLSTIGALIALPRDQITRRFGRSVVLRLDQALGRAREALTYRRPPNPWFAHRAFAEPISAPEDMARITADIVADLCARLEVESQGGRRFELAFHRVDGVVQNLTIGLALPGREVSAIVRLFAPRLETIDPGFGIEVVTLLAEGVQTLCPRQGRWDEDRETLSQGVAPLVDRLTNRLGESAVWRNEAFPSHDPERAVTRRPPLASRSALAPETGWNPERPRPVRLLRRPEPIEVMALVPDDPPVSFRWRGLPHRVRRAEGPERLAEEWWRRPFEDASPGRARDYYRVEDEAGGRFWLFRDGLYQAGTSPRWWLHGLFG